LIEEIGTLTAKRVKQGNSLLTVRANVVLDDLKIGDSVAVSGPCLTVTDIERDRFTVEATSYTVENSSIADWQVGRKLNLERALRVGDRLGGHFVQGHVDGVGKVDRIKYGSGATHIHIAVSNYLLQLMAPKGSVTVDGVSLTLADKSARSFQIMVIPHTLEKTTLGELHPGSRINIETDLIIRWLADRFKDGEVISDPSDVKRSMSDINYHLED